MARAETRVYALLNISVVGQSTFSTENPHGELLDLQLVDAKLAAATIARHRDRILGVKVRLTRNIAGKQDLEVLGRACAAAREAQVPVMAHIGGSHSPLGRILGVLQPGDVITHAFRAGEGGFSTSAASCGLRCAMREREAFGSMSGTARTGSRSRQPIGRCSKV